MSTQAEAAKLIRKDLKEAFPTIKFKVTSQSFSMGDSVDVRYVDGPTTKQVDEIIRKYQYGSFNGMEDIYEHTNKQDFPQSKYVHSQRTLTWGASKYTADRIKEKYGIEIPIRKEFSEYEGFDVARSEKNVWLENHNCWNNNFLNRICHETDFTNIKFEEEKEEIIKEIIEDVYNGEELELKMLGELQASYKKSNEFDTFKINSSKLADKFSRKIYPVDINTREAMIALFVNTNNEVICYSVLSIGGLKGTICDPKILFQHGLLSNAAGFIVVHNHPSGNLKPSEVDIKITKKLKEGGVLMDITMLDHLILTDDSYYSFADEGAF